MFQASRETAVDNTKIAAESIKGRSLERRAAMKASQRVATAGMNAVAKTKIIRIKEKQLLLKVRQKVRRLAWLEYLDLRFCGWRLRDEARNSCSETGEEQEAKRDEQWRSYGDRPKFTLTKISKAPNTDAPDIERPEGSIEPTADDDDEDSTPLYQKPSKGLTPPTSSQGFRSDVYNYLTQHHKLSKNKALGLMANIDRESSFRINPQGGDGGNSFGMFQWNNTWSL